MQPWQTAHSLHVPTHAGGVPFPHSLSSIDALNMRLTDAQREAEDLREQLKATEQSFAKELTNIKALVAAKLGVSLVAAAASGA